MVYSSNDGDGAGRRRRRRSDSDSERSPSPYPDPGYEPTPSPEYEYPVMSQWTQYPEKLETVKSEWRQYVVYAGMQHFPYFGTHFLPIVVALLIDYYKNKMGSAILFSAYEDLHYSTLQELWADRALGMYEELLDQGKMVYPKAFEDKEFVLEMYDDIAPDFDCLNMPDGFVDLFAAICTGQEE